MILGIGTDIVEVDRLHHWSSFSQQKLARVFTQQELEDCWSKASKCYMPEKLAVRFAAREAFYKALSAMLAGAGLQPCSFLLVSSHVCVVKDKYNIPQLHVDWRFLADAAHLPVHSPSVHLSLSHEKKHALAFVVLSEQ